MKRFLIFVCLSSLTTAFMLAQNDAASPLPYHQIPEYPESYRPGNVVGRMIDGLGYRYYWATKDLRKEDLAYQPSDDARTTAETLDHLYGLSETIVNAPQSLPNIRPADWSDMSFEEKRRKTLENFQRASDLVKQGSEKDMEDYKVIFQRGGSPKRIPLLEYAQWSDFRCHLSRGSDRLFSPGFRESNPVRGQCIYWKDEGIVLQELYSLKSATGDLKGTTGSVFKASREGTTNGFVYQITS